jgi:hypothetical protein
MFRVNERCAHDRAAEPLDQGDSGAQLGTRFRPIVHVQHAVARSQRVHGDLQAFFLFVKPCILRPPPPAYHTRETSGYGPAIKAIPNRRSKVRHCARPRYGGGGKSVAKIANRCAHVGFPVKGATSVTPVQMGMGILISDFFGF